MTCADCDGPREDCFNSLGERYDCRTKAARAMIAFTRPHRLTAPASELPRTVWLDDEGQPTRVTCDLLFDRIGRITWFGVRWRGVPKPIISDLRRRHGYPLTGYGQCGCIDQLKLLQEDLIAVWRWSRNLWCRTVRLVLRSRPRHG